MIVSKHSLWFVPVLFASLTLKLYETAPPNEDMDQALAGSGAMLTKAGFQVHVEKVGHGRVTIKRGACIAQLRLMDSHGIADSFYRTTFAVDYKIRYAWRGEWTSDRPWAGPLLEYYIKREFARIGVPVHRSPLWIAGIGRQCNDAFPAAFSMAPVLMRPAGR